MADYAGSITVQVRRALEPDNVSRTWTIENLELAMAGMLIATTGTKMDTGKTFQVNTTVSPDVTLQVTTITEIITWISNYSSG